MSDVRDFAADQRKAIEDKLASVKKEKGDTGHLESLLQGNGPEAAGEAVLISQPMPPGTVEPGTLVVPVPSQQPEPADGSAPDKRDQDNSPVHEEQDGVSLVTGPKDPGPGAKESGDLPTQAPGFLRPKKRLAPGELPDQEFEHVEPEETDREQLQKEARQKDRRRDKAEAEDKISAENKGLKATLENKAQPKSAPARKPDAK